MSSVVFFFFNDTATTEIYTLSLHDALPICIVPPLSQAKEARRSTARRDVHGGFASLCGMKGASSGIREDRKSTRLNSSHANISYAVFCLKKKKKHNSQ